MPSSAKPDLSNFSAEPFPVEFVDECDSTNRVLVDRVRSNQVIPVLLVARRQSAGKGRLGRSWEAPVGSAFTGSWLIPIRDSPWGEFPWLLSFGVALGVGDFLAELGLIDQFHLKWPNDIMTNADKKLCGILAEYVSTSTSSGAVAAAVVVGAGLNLTRPEVVEGVLAERGAWVSELLDGNAHAYTAAFQLSVDTVAPALNHHVSHWLQGDGLQGSPRQAIIEYRKRCSTIGQSVRVEQVDSTWEGVAIDVSDDGGLVVIDTDGLTHRVTAADVVHLNTIKKEQR